MRTTRKTRSRLSQLGRLAIAAGLALGGGASFANAVVNITSFTVTTDGFPIPGFGKFAVASSPTADIGVTALNAGGLGGAQSNAYSANVWQTAPNVTATTTYAKASGAPGVTTDPLTGQNIGTFDLSAISNRSFGVYSGLSLPNTATANANQTGQFTLIDDNSLPVAGTLTFDIFYNLSVSSPVGFPPKDFSEASVNFSVSTDDEGPFDFSDLLLSYASPSVGGVGNVSGHFMWTVNLSAGETAYFSLAGTALSSSANIPEPGGLALACLALVALGASGRRTKPTS